MADLIVIGYDGSPASEHAIIAARGLLSAPRAVVVSVWESTPPPVPIAPSDGFVAPQLDPAAAREIDELSQRRGSGLADRGADAARAAGFEAEALAVPDARNVADTLAEVAADRGAVAVVVGARGHSALHDRLLGSTSSALLHRAGCPVLVVPVERA